MRAGRAARREEVEAAIASLKRRVDEFSDEIKSAIDALRAELLTGAGRDEHHRPGTEGDGSEPAVFD